MEKAKKIVITGGPTCGKTTLLDELNLRGYNVVPEAAREVILQRGKRELNKYEHELRQHLIYDLQTKREEEISGTAFLDRGTIDNVAYSKHFLGYVPFEIPDPNYSAVVLLERLPFQPDGVRIESGDEEAGIIHEGIMQAYMDYGYPILILPKMSGKTIEEAVKKRADFLIESLEGILND